MPKTKSQILAMMGAKWDLVKQRLLSIQRRLGIAPDAADQEVQAIAESAKRTPMSCAR
jgi:hypothetical protein